MNLTTYWSLERFPVLYQGNEVQGVLVDITTFAQIELILDNLLNRNIEEEDAFLAASKVLKQILAKAQQELPSTDWEVELAAL